jgi:hypothetical protein
MEEREMNRAKTRAEAIRQYRHYRAMVECKRLNEQERRLNAERANALAERFNLTTVKL